MSEEKKELVTPHKHWREMTDNSFLYAEMFEPGVDKIFTIKAVIAETLENPVTKSEETKPVLYFEETDLKLALNKANRVMISKLFGTGFVDEWVGRQIQLFATTTAAFGEIVPCIRIRNFLPELKCSVCGKVIDKATYFGSIRGYGKPYCSRECLEKDKNGEQLL